ncbi:unnamed protein product [Symbiodinium microadriaticum]|nr:unnamed protein product [Symbiodinium microadriaticum]
MLNPEKWQQDFDMPSRLPNLYMKSNKPFTPTLFKKGFPEKRVKWINMKIGEIPDALFLEDQKMIKRLEDELSVLGTFDEVKAFFKKHEDDMKTKEGGGDTDIKSITVLSARSGKLRIQTAAPFPPQYNKRPCPFADLVQTDPDPQAIAISLPQKMEAGATYDCLCYLEEATKKAAYLLLPAGSSDPSTCVLCVMALYNWSNLPADGSTLSNEDVSLPDNGGARGAGKGRRVAGLKMNGSKICGN